jgi:hypothetical protein
MATPIYSSITSLDSYVTDEDGNFDWGVPDEQVHTFFNDLEGLSAPTFTGAGCTR